MFMGLPPHMRLWHSGLPLTCMTLCLRSTMASSHDDGMAAEQQLSDDTAAKQLCLEAAYDCLQRRLVEREVDVELRLEKELEAKRLQALRFNPLQRLREAPLKLQAAVAAIAFVVVVAL